VDRDERSLLASPAAPAAPLRKSFPGLLGPYGPRYYPLEAHFHQHWISPGCTLKFDSSYFSEKNDSYLSLLINELITRVFLVSYDISQMNVLGHV